MDNVKERRETNSPMLGALLLSAVLGAFPDCTDTIPLCHGGNESCADSWFAKRCCGTCGSRVTDGPLVGQGTYILEDPSGSRRIDPWTEFGLQLQRDGDGKEASWSQFGQDLFIDSLFRHMHHGT